jgi:hypothetical protein
MKHKEHKRLSLKVMSVCIPLIALKNKTKKTNPVHQVLPLMGMGNSTHWKKKGVG